MAGIKRESLNERGEQSLRELCEYGLAMNFHKLTFRELRSGGQGLSAVPVQNQLPHQVMLSP